MLYTVVKNAPNSKWILFKFVGWKSLFGASGGLVPQCVGFPCKFLNIVAFLLPVALQRRKQKAPPLRSDFPTIIISVPRFHRFPVFGRWTLTFRVLESGGTVFLPRGIQTITKASCYLDRLASSL